MPFFGYFTVIISSVVAFPQPVSMFLTKKWSWEFPQGHRSESVRGTDIAVRAGSRPSDEWG